jgi:hypothetical protein
MMEQGDAGIRARFKEWDREIARLQEGCLAAAAPEAERLRAVLAGLAAARERAWARWELARAGGMWVTQDDGRQFEEAMRMAAEAFGRSGAGRD